MSHLTKVISVVELCIGILLLTAALLFSFNGHFCYLKHASCGMVEPILAFYSFILGVSIAMAGWLHLKAKLIVGTIALVPAGMVLLILIGEAQQWW